MSDKPQVAIVTPIFNGKTHTLAFLKSLTKQDYSNIVTIITDDGSTDGSGDAIRQEFPDTVVLQGDGNLWWTGSTNLGVQYALDHGIKYVITINNDVKLNKDTVSNLMKAAESHPKTLVGSLVCYETDADRVWYAGGFFDRRIGQLAHKVGKRSDYIGLVPAEWLTGMGMLIPVAAFKAVGLFDPAFPQYFADSDFSLRAKKAGFDLVVDSDSVVRADIESSWLNRQKKTGKLNFLPTLLFNNRSPFSIKLRYKFYKRHWGRGWRMALVRLYANYFWRLAHKYRDTMEHI